jgi:hypothetical protein
MRLASPSPTLQSDQYASNQSAITRSQTLDGRNKYDTNENSLRCVLKIAALSQVLNVVQEIIKTAGQGTVIYFYKHDKEHINTRTTHFETITAFVIYTHFVGIRS